ncbi:hypothetical protein H4219_005292 [Mycoemilia scoparia]|uniref:Uncharacterized protein n=1 Tax=Mycoemilia scoparia TaxID=417184 RepID=A0A9W7ZNK6_9FUNG|nr:hypothetical protein H4219_005292 [Mycoemilia scoparia]
MNPTSPNSPSSIPSLTTSGASSPSFSGTEAANRPCVNRLNEYVDAVGACIYFLQNPAAHYSQWPAEFAHRQQIVNSVTHSDFQDTMAECLGPLDEQQKSVFMRNNHQVIMALLHRTFVASTNLCRALGMTVNTPANAGHGEFPTTGVSEIDEAIQEFVVYKESVRTQFTEAENDNVVYSPADMSELFLGTVGCCDSFIKSIYSIHTKVNEAGN